VPVVSAGAPPLPVLVLLIDSPPCVIGAASRQAISRRA
jgi:hypothetical protein